MHLHWQEQWYLATASCGGSGDSKTQTADSSTGSLEKVEMYTIPAPQMSAAHVIAMEKGYYEEECLEKGMTEPYGHAVSRPPVVEVEATERAISLAKLAKATLYVAHVTAKGQWRQSEMLMQTVILFSEKRVHTT